IGKDQALVRAGGRLHGGLELARSYVALRRQRRQLAGKRLLDDRLGRGQVLFHEQRRQRQHIADVIEAVPNVVGGEILGRLEVERQQIADRVVILGPVESPE